MTPETLREMMKNDDAELRRAAVLAAAMKDDKAHVPDLIARLADDDELVVRAARAGLKSLSDGRDFGPPPGATRLQRETSAKAWREWWAGRK
jgi:HEAT repeat protein